MSETTIDTQAVVAREPAAAVRAEDFMPLMRVDQAVERKGMINQFIAKVLVENEDYGKMPGGQTKKVLMKPGAEKLCSIFGLSPRYVKEIIVEDWTGEKHGGEPLFSYEYRCQLYRGERFMGEAIGSCNSWEAKYRYRWMPEDQVRERADFDRLMKRGSVKTIFEPVFALDKRETDGKYGKPAQYWDDWQQAITDKTARFTKKLLGKKEYDGWERQVDTTLYRVPNPDVADVINTCQKMAQKRALVAAVLVVTNCSDAFTQDLEDQMQDEPEQHHQEPVSRPNTAAAASGHAVPSELTKVFENIDADLGAVRDAYSRMEGLMIRKAGDAGKEAYDAIAEMFGQRYPQGTKDKQAHKNMLLDLWDAYQKVQPREEVKA